MQRNCLASCFLLLAVGCQSAAGISQTATAHSSTGIRSIPPTASYAPALTLTNSPSSPALAPFHVDLSQPFSDITLTAWTPAAYAGPAYTLPLTSSQIGNIHVADDLTAAERASLWTNGSMVMHSQEDHFSDLRESIEGGQPYFLTVDAAYHSLHQNFDETLKTLERDYFRTQVKSILQATLDEILNHESELTETTLETDVHYSNAYLSVALQLLDSNFQPDPSVQNVVQTQVSQIMAAGGPANSALFADFKDDYGAYKPVGHYAGDPDLESYFRAMTWLGRVNFALKDNSRLPLIITLALRQAEVKGAPASDAWGDIHRILDFVIGPTDDAGPLEYAALMDKVYGDHLTYAMLADDSKWGEFRSHADELPTPQINSLFVAHTTDMVADKGWRFMGQRFTMDEYIFQNLIYDKVAENSQGERRNLPTGLDVMSVFGSSTARNTIAELKLDQYGKYDSQLALLVQGVHDQPETQWTNRFYSSWLYSFLPTLEPKNNPYPPFMQTPAWGYIDMNSALGSWAELKHDTVLYTKQAEGLGGGGPPGSGPAPAYVEPNPNAFYRMAYAARSLAAGLENDPAVSSLDMSPSDSSIPLPELLEGISRLGDSFQSFGDMATKELNGEQLSEDDYGALWACLGSVECNTMPSDYHHTESEMPPTPVIASVAGGGTQILEAGVGKVDRIYVVVPLEGKWMIAQGGVFSYYEFPQPRDNRLTDQQWRDMLASNSPPALPAWASHFIFSGGKPKAWTIFKIGDWYLTTEAGNATIVHDNPALKAKAVGLVKTGDYFNIVGGPVTADGYTWWQIQNWPEETPGWLVENQEWYIRV